MPSTIPKKTNPKPKSKPKTQEEKPKFVGFMSMSSYTSTVNSKTKKPVTIQEAYQVIQTNNGKVTGFYEKKKDGKTITKKPIKNLPIPSNIKTQKAKKSL